MSRIKLLPTILANQNAAGEVIERPFSVVKELVENSIDAGATRIEIEIIDAGKKLIAVKDNGAGIAREDLPLALTKHATSKIIKACDLTAISTLGFRGEALASISAVSRFSISSSTNDDGLGYQITCHGDLSGAVGKCCAHPQGTSIVVRDLFFNVPARLKFLKSPKTEVLHIIDHVKRLALSEYGIEFVLKIDHKLCWHLPKALVRHSQQQRIQRVLGKGFSVHAQYHSIEQDNMQLAGWFAPTSYHRGTNDEQLFYLNSRVIKDKVLLHAVRSAYADFLPAARAAAFIIYLRLPFVEFDINVHPSKQEVRLLHERQVYEFIYRSVRQFIAGSKTPHHTPVITKQHAAVAPKVAAAADNIVDVAYRRYVFIKQDAECYLADLKKIWMSCCKFNNELYTLKIPAPAPCELQQGKALQALLEQLNFSVEISANSIKLVRVPCGLEYCARPALLVELLKAPLELDNVKKIILSHAWQVIEDTLTLQEVRELVHFARKMAYNDLFKKLSLATLQNLV